jgi:hypothetical protein
MGSHDVIKLVGASDALRCAHGHEVREFQTKDLGESLATYFVCDGRLYKLDQNMDGPRHHSEDYRLEGDTLVVTRQEKATLVSAGEVVVYSRCTACLPVLVETSNDWMGAISEHHPWVQFVLRFEGSRLMERRPDRVETRDDVRKKHPEAIPDDDRVARRHFERRASKGTP